MSKIKITTLTPIHIGNGVTLQYGADFVTGGIASDDGRISVVGIIDPKKVLSLIGEENISHWVAAIDRKSSTDVIVKQFAPKASIEDYTARVIVNYSAIRKNDTLKELIHDGMGKPYIPGSSIKGAIRTAVLASLASKVNGVAGKIERQDKNNRSKGGAKSVEGELFGADPTTDVFRFLHVGDAIFGDNYELAAQMVSINERPSKGFWDTDKQQLIETICPDDETEFQMKLLPEYYDFAQRNWSQNEKRSLGKMPDEMKTMAALFSLINEHTRGLIASEIKYWQDKELHDDSNQIAVYIQNMQKMLDTANSCRAGKECVLRVGYGSGWRFITGAWTEELGNFESVVVPAARRDNYKYQKIDFPKSRRVDEDCELLGFVKLTVL